MPYAANFAGYLAALTEGKVVYRGGDVSWSEILHESRFSDVIVVDPEVSLKRVEREFPGKFFRDVLALAECPVVVSPYSFRQLDKVIFAYDGTASSVFAIKQFTYLFPGLKVKKAVVVSASENAYERLAGWFSYHYPDNGFELMAGDVADELFAYLIDKKDSLVVLGAYGQGVLSRFFKPSQAELLLKSVNLPLFIAHPQTCRR